jgi:hypothetical protein
VAFSGPGTSVKTKTLSNANDTIAELGQTNTFTALNQFSAGAVLGNGATGAGFLRLLEDSDNGTDYSTITGGADAGTYPSFVFGGSQGAETFAVTATSDLWTLSSGTGATFAFTPAVAFTAAITASGGVTLQNAETITNGDDTEIAFNGTESIALDLDAGTNVVAWKNKTTSSSGVTEMNFSALNLVTTGIIHGAIKTSGKSADYTIGTDDADEAYGTVFLNTAASTRTFTLPSAVAGMSVCIKNDQAVAQILRLDANTGDYIVKETGARTSASAEYYGSTADAGAMLCVVAYDATDWHVTSARGTWTEE